MLIPLQEFLYINMSHERIADQERIVIKRAILKSHDNREGILLEKVLHNLDMPIQMASYELI